MPKIPELTNAQLEKLIEKHSKILNKLRTEKNKRSPKETTNSDIDLDLTNSAFQLNLEQEGINQEQIEEEAKLEEQDSDMIRVTRLLKLSPEQLDELNKNSNKKKKLPKKKKTTT